MARDKYARRDPILGIAVFLVLLAAALIFLIVTGYIG
jgi:hypothetical protein